jgi:hypothetical protein
MDMPIAASFEVIALRRLVHRHVMWRAVLPHLSFSEFRLCLDQFAKSNDSGKDALNIDHSLFKNAS